MPAAVAAPRPPAAANTAAAAAERGSVAACRTAAAAGSGKVAVTERRNFYISARRLRLRIQGKGQGGNGITTIRPGIEHSDIGIIAHLWQYGECHPAFKSITITSNIRNKLVYTLKK